MFSKTKLIAACVAAILWFNPATASAAPGLIGSQVAVGLYVSGDYIDANYGTTGTDPNALFLDPDGDPLRTLTIAEGSSLDFFNTFFGTYMTLRFTANGFTLTNLIPDPFPTANFLGLKIDILMGPDVTSLAIDEAASAADFREGIVPERTARQISVNLQGVCADTCSVADDTVVFNVTTVPEPTTWCIMVLGFGMMGAALRRRMPVAIA